jgi:hypothetical protein
MRTDLFETLNLLKTYIRRMSIADKNLFVSHIPGKLHEQVLKTSDSNHTFSEENILSVGLGALVTNSRNEFEAICGFYGGGYQSDLRKGIYHGKGDIPNNQWRKEIRRLYRNIKEHIGNMTLPPLRNFQYQMG